MKKKSIALVIATVMGLSVMVAGCGSKTEESGADTNVEAAVEASVEAVENDAVAEQATVEEVQAEQVSGEAQTAEGGNDNASSAISFEQVDKGDLSLENALQPQGGALPAYEYPGPELFYTVVYDYIANVIGKGYLPGDVTIPCPIIVAEDESNKSDILLYGNFCVYNYTLGQDGETLMTISGGSHPGCMHLASTDAGYEVTGFDAVADGSDYEPTAKKIFGSYYEEFSKKMSDDKLHEETRAQIISNYAAANNLPITGYQDYGWEKKALPTENIDSFYSDL